MIDIIKFVIAVAVLIGSIAVFYLYPEESTLLRSIGIVIGVFIAGFIGYQTEKGKTFFSFVVAARQELRKIVWPSKKESNQTTLIVIIAVVMLGLLLWLIDMLLSASLSWLIG